MMYRPLALALLLSVCSDTPLDPVASDPACDVPTVFGELVAFQNVVTLSFDDGRAESGQTLVISGDRILDVGPDGTVEVPDGATLVPGCGRFLVPGLADMHVHLSRADLPGYLAAGVTTVRNLWGFTDLLAMKGEVEEGTLDGPTVYAISSGLDGTPAKWPFTQFVLEPGDAERIVAEQVELGYRTLKLYQDLTPDPFDEIVAAAKAQGVDYGGHVPHRVGLEHALASGYRFIEHLSGYETILSGGGQLGAFAWRNVDASLVPGLVAQTVESGTWNAPTLEIFAQIAAGDPRVVTNRQAFVKALFDAGAPLLIGTDSGIGRTQPGISLHQEIGQFVSAGLTRLEALRIATVEAARFLGEEDEFGRLLPGMRADVLLVANDPLEDLNTLANPVVVVARGKKVAP